MKILHNQIIFKFFPRFIYIPIDSEAIEYSIFIAYEAISGPYSALLFIKKFLFFSRKGAKFVYLRAPPSNSAELFINKQFFISSVKIALTKKIFGSLDFFHF